MDHGLNVKVLAKKKKEEKNEKRKSREIKEQAKSAYSYFTPKAQSKEADKLDLVKIKNLLY